MIRASAEPKFYLSRKSGLESCMVIASYIDDLDIKSGRIDDFSRLMICGTGSLRGPLNLDIIATLCLEVTTQLNEYGPRMNSDPLEALRKAGRKPILDKLEHIKEQLLQIIALGSASLKRYNFLAGMLAQIRALETGQSVDTAVYEAVKQSLKNSYDALLASQTVNTPPDSIDSLINAPTTISSESFDFDMGLLDPGQFFDPLNIFSLSEVPDGTQYGTDFL
ncbi:putative c6 transcription protein [Phaeoacremonium minimum UCRPA7]|uniref:Putative c6 transcription protein n=1 Tax=Phaeoacremonium minimum (strain UCR-PA7) TaxID=1286976 RepID=R8BJQ9_PHAM7|nr:putative c6 transcription protein [Phaeoacremonium minimum UCRPA7]EON99452.1 putative c6 transcription protein [Phaeoacremonium minimum UCRPA7]